MGGRRQFVAFLGLILSSTALPIGPVAAAPVPRLVVVVSVDQLPARYLVEMQENFATDGIFAKLRARGAWFSECYHRHAFTVTAPGHAAMLTGADPALHGIISNGWFDRATGKTVNCVEDEQAAVLGAPAKGYGVSPRNLLAPTVGDTLKLTRGSQAKVFGVSLKDRAAVLMTGHSADAAFWFDENSGNWVTSSYYQKELPGYMRNFNDGDAAEAFVGQAWELLLEPARYQHLVPDDNPYETNVPFFGRAFPHPMPKQAGGIYYRLLEATPFGNALTLAAAGQIIEHEQLGQDDIPDLLCVGLSANDYVGHAFGPQSLEVQDITLRTDQQLGEFATYIDRQLGGAPWMFVLSSDHGVAPVPEFAASLKLPGLRGPLGDLTTLAKRIEEGLQATLGTPADGKKYIRQVEPGEIYLQHDLPELAGDRFIQAQRLVQRLMLQESAVAAAHTRDELLQATSGSGLFEQFRLAFNPRRSGDLLFVLSPYAIPSGKNAATHGSPWIYDTHVPLAFMGAGIRVGQFTARVSPCAVAPTLARLLNLDSPAACSVNALVEALD